MPVQTTAIPKTVELLQMLAARERRAARRQALLRQYGCPLLCFTMNIAGPVKNSPLITRGFAYGRTLLGQALAAAGAAVRHTEGSAGLTGCEAYYAVELAPAALKQLAVELEDDTPLGRLFDLDVWQPDGAQLGRAALGLPERRCLLCGGPAKLCARSRTHTVAALQAKTSALLQQVLDDADAEKIAELATRSLLYEVCTTPKPGLVDRANNGSHKDMDIFTFMNSTAALTPYFRSCGAIGRATAGSSAPDTLAALRPAGRRAETAMLAATGGVNTHKGAIFSMGIVCGALGRLPRAAWAVPERVLGEVAAMAAGLVERDFGGLTPQTAKTTGQKLYLAYGITGARGQVEAGLPAVSKTGLPVLEEGLRRGKTLNEAGCAVLLAILGVSVDTNLIARSDRATQQRVAGQAAAILRSEPYPDAGILGTLDAVYTGLNLSPGGSADLLAVCYLLHFLRAEQDKT